MLQGALGGRSSGGLFGGGAAAGGGGLGGGGGGSGSGGFFGNNAASRDRDRDSAPQVDEQGIVHARRGSVVLGARSMMAPVASRKGSAQATTT